MFTALRGCPSFVTWAIHPENGKTPSLAIANMSLEAAMTATDEFYIRVDLTNPNQDQAQNSDGVHDTMSILSKSECIEIDEWLGWIETGESIQIRRTEKEKNQDRETG